MPNPATFVLLVVLAACGGKSATPSSSTGAHDHTAAGSADGHDHHQAGSASEGHDHHAAGSGDHHATGSGDHHATGSGDQARLPEPAPDPAKVKAELLASEQATYASAKPVFDKFCAKCHSKSGRKWSQKKGDHFNMTTYPFGGHHAMEISGAIRKALAIGGGKPTMPYGDEGAVKGDELALIAAWADAFDKAHAAGAHEGTGHAHDHDHGHKH